MPNSNDDKKILHRLIRYVSGIAAASFFTEIRVIGGENVPKDGPIIVTATHHNMIIDPVILSVAFPYKRILNYWSKASLFANPVLRYILYSSGNIPVDRKSKDRQTLFEGTFEALSKGQAVALFPEGTSYTEPRIMQIKDGASWAALEFVHWLKNNPSKSPRREVQVIPAAIVYTNKSKYRSSVVMEFGRPITMDAFKDDFFSGEEGLRRAAVKRLTRMIETSLTEMTINAPNWDTLFVARMARDLLWEGEKGIDLDEFVAISQTLVDLFSADVTPNANAVRRHLLNYYSLLQSSQLTNSVLSSLPLPNSLDPHTPATIPSRFFTLLILLKDSISAISRLPFFLLPLLVHLPVYFTSRLGANLVEDEEETQAQNKVAFGLLSSLLIYPTTFLFLWALLYYKPAGAILAAFAVYLFASYHNRVIDDAYARQVFLDFQDFKHLQFSRTKRIVAAWRVLVGVWAPKRWDVSLTALSQYTTPRIPPENPWIDKPRMSPTPASTGEMDPLQHTKNQRKQRAPSRRIVRHVLRARIDAIKSLVDFFDSLEKAGKGKQVRASAHLARLYGVVDGGFADYGGWRYAREVVEFLKARGAKIPKAPKGVIEGWASGDDYTTTEEH